MNYVSSSFLLAASMAIPPLFAGTMTDIDTLGTSSYSARVSPDGSIVLGQFEINGQSHVFSWRAGVMTDLGGGSYAEPYAMTADGSVIVGEDNSNGQSHAFRWTSGVMTDLGGGSYSYAKGVSADGLVVIGQSDARAFRWASGIMTDLGTFGGPYSDANAISADGSVIVGTANIANGNTRAFRWVSGAMTDLGTLGGDNSEASRVTPDGSVVVGSANIANGNTHAFRWESGIMTDLGTLGGTLAAPNAVSADGSVIVGLSYTAAGKSRAFRWTSGVMTDLGTLGGDTSNAHAVSADGSVVVGIADTASGESHAYRWKSGVMTDLGTLGGNSSYASDVSADGSVVVGQATNANGDSRAFIYSDRVMLDAQDWLGSVGGVYSMLSTSLDLSRAHLEGAHHRPLAELGRGKSYWATGDVAGSSRSRDLITRSGEAGMTFEPWSNVLVGIGAGYGRQDQQLLNDGSATTFGQYLIGEIDFLLADGGIVSVLVSSGDWQNETDRSYVTGGGVDFSHGETDIKSTSFRVRYDTPTLVKTLGTDIKAYGSYGQSRARADGFTETGGSYAGSFSEMEQTAKEGRLGVAATRAFGEKFRGRLSAEWIRRFDREQAAITATDITSTLDLTLPGAAVQRDQARLGFDLDYLMDAKTTLSFTVHAAGRGESADVSGAISLRKGF
jgi:probable HAF family extracellular repeat protein